jgi:GntR family transcriptional regulator
MSIEFQPRPAVGKTRPGRQTSPRRIRDLIFTSVHSGDLDADVLLTEDNLINEFEASRNAVRGALRTLANEGVVERQPRTGTKVVGSFSSIDLNDESVSLAAGAPVYQEIIESEFLTAPPVLHKVLKLDPAETQIRMVENTFVQNGGVIGIRSAYYSTRFASDEHGINVGLPALESYFGEKIHRIESVVGSNQADERTSRLLGIVENSSVIYRQQLFLNPDLRPIQLVFDHFRADTVVFRTSTQRT